MKENMEKLGKDALCEIVGGEDEANKFLDNFKSLTKSKQFKVIGSLLLLGGGATAAGFLIKDMLKSGDNSVGEVSSNEVKKIDQKISPSYIEGIDRIRRKDSYMRRRRKVLKGDVPPPARKIQPNIDAPKSPLALNVETFDDEDCDDE